MRDWESPRRKQGDLEKGLGVRNPQRSVGIEIAKERQGQEREGGPEAFGSSGVVVGRLWLEWKGSLVQAVKCLHILQRDAERREELAENVPSWH